MPFCGKRRLVGMVMIIVQCLFNNKAIIMPNYICCIFSSILNLIIINVFSIGCGVKYSTLFGETNIISTNILKQHCYPEHTPPLQSGHPIFSLLHQDFSCPFTPAHLSFRVEFANRRKYYRSGFATACRHDDDGLSQPRKFRL